MIFKKHDERLRCSFCGKSQDEVKKLIAGPSVHICNECIDICNEIIADDQQAEMATKGRSAPEASVETAVGSLPRVVCPFCGSVFEAGASAAERL